MSNLKRSTSYSQVAGACHVLDDKEFNFINELKDEYNCLVCRSLLRDPIQLLPCGHRFCNSCYLGFSNDGSSSSRIQRCPVDSVAFTSNQVFPDRGFRNTIMDLKVRCKFQSCSWIGTLRSLLEKHVDECEYEDIKCPDPNCNVVLSRSRVEYHLNNECQWRVVVCEYCEDKYAVCKTEVHKATCRGVPEKCPNGCLTMNIPRGQMKAHLEHYCPLTILPCQYRHVGCNEEIVRRDMQEHLDENIQKHLDDACNKIRAINLDLREKTLQLAQNSTKLTSLSIELARNVTGNGTLVWAIDDFTNRYNKAKSGHEIVIDSEPASSGPYGYRFCGLVYLHGDKTGKGTHMSVFIQLLRGKYDALLKWPFQQEVKFTLIDQQNDENERRNIVKILAAAGNNEGIVNFQRPISKDRNNGRGFAKFVTHDVMRTRRYIRDDVMFLKIEVQPTGMV